MPPPAADGLTFEELVLAAGVEGAATPTVMTTQSASVTTNMIWYELFGIREELAKIDIKVDELVIAAEEAEPWEEMGEDEVEELAQQIDDCLGSPGS